MGRRDRARPNHLGALRVICSHRERPDRAGKAGTREHSVAKKMPMTLILLMVFEIGVALALGFVVGRIYQIRRHELERGFTLPPTAHIPRP